MELYLFDWQLVRWHSMAPPTHVIVVKRIPSLPPSLSPFYYYFHHHLFLLLLFSFYLDVRARFCVCVCECVYFLSAGEMAC